MDKIWLYAIASTFGVSIISLIGVFLLSLKKNKLNAILIPLMSFAAGTMLGNVLFHLLPESYEHLKPQYLTAWLTIGGYFIFFVMEKVIHSHHSHSHSQEDKHEIKKIKSFGYLSLYADSLHNLTDGILIGAAWMTSSEIGLMVTLAIVLHEIPQEIGDFGILIKAGFTKGKALFFNFLTALTAVLGTIITLWIGQTVENFSGFIIPIAAGGFIYLTMNSLFPEIYKETTKKNFIWNLLFLLIGLALMYYFSLHGGAHENVH